MAWDNKDTPKLHWRGKTTGDAFSARDDYNWRNSHRIRLHTLTHDKKGHRELYVKSRRTGGWEIQTWEAGKVNEAYMDVGLTDGPMQCNKEDGTCKEMQDAIDWSPRVQPQDAANFKCESTNACRVIHVLTARCDRWYVVGTALGVRLMSQWTAMDGRRASTDCSRQNRWLSKAPSTQNSSR